MAWVETKTCGLVNLDLIENIRQSNGTLKVLPIKWERFGDGYTIAEGNNETMRQVANKIVLMAQDNVIIIQKDIRRMYED